MKNMSKKEYLITFYDGFVNNKKLLENLYSLNNYKYEQILNIAASLPFKQYGYKDSDYIKKFNEIITLPKGNEDEPQLTRFYEFLKQQFKEYGISNLTGNEIMIRVIKFAKENKEAMFLNKDGFDTIENELKRIDWNFNTFKNTSNIKQVCRTEKRINESIDKIGQLQIFEALKNAGINAYHVTRNLGSGFGYDIYGKIDNKEELYNVKTSKAITMINEKDRIELTDGEFKVLEDSIDKCYRDYYIARVYTSLSENNYFNYMLRAMKDNNEIILKDEEKNKIYRLDKENCKQKNFTEDWG